MGSYLNTFFNNANKTDERIMAPVTLFLLKIVAKLCEILSVSEGVCTEYFGVVDHFANIHAASVLQLFGSSEEYFTVLYSNTWDKKFAQ
jgi:hypothetical protein